MGMGVAHIKNLMTAKLVNITKKDSVSYVTKVVLNVLVQGQTNAYHA